MPAFSTRTLLAANSSPVTTSPHPLGTRSPDRQPVVSVDSHDPYLEPGTHCLRNRFGITDPDLLAVVEAETVANRTIELANNPGLVTVSWDRDHWQNLHLHLFGDLYGWAGQFRTVDISKDGHRFHPVSRLNIAIGYCTDQIQDLATGPTLGLDQLPRRLSAVLSHMNETHPFREGNGRTQRTLIGQIANTNGAHIDWTQIDPEENITASKAAGHNEHAFAELLTRATRPLPYRDTPSGGRRRD